MENERMKLTLERVKLGDDLLKGNLDYTIKVTNRNEFLDEVIKDFTKVVNQEFEEYNGMVNCFDNDEYFDIWISIERKQGNVAEQRKHIEKELRYYIKHMNKMYK